MFLIQHPSPLSSLAYLFGCTGKRAAIAVDVHAGDEEAFLAMAREKDVEIRYVIDTHIHADHVSGGRRLAHLAGAHYALHESNTGAVPWDFMPLRDGQVLEAGNVSVQVLHTPGHTDDSITLLVTDRSRCDEPWFLVTGHTLFVGAVGRPDLRGREREMAEKLYDSLFGKLLSLPDHLEILPGAQAGSVCGGGISGKPVSTLAFEKRYNKGLVRDRTAFVEAILETALALPQPEAMREIIAANIAAEIPA
ncbi:MAG TPA: MBL fold metallo-hydrolase [Chromatiales bacterium]|nr:MBL fold metallo-hydrolase [Chromatiales bacterium]